MGRFICLAVLVAGLWKWDWITAPNNSANAIAILAFVATALQAYYAKQHNRLSVRPYLSTFKKAGTKQIEEAIHIDYEFTLSNCGLGPAIIQSYQVCLDGVPTQVKEPEEFQSLVLRTVGGAALDPYFGIMRPHSVLKVNEEMTVAKLTLVVNPAPLERLEQVARDVQRFSLLVRFKSGYNESFVYDSRVHRATPLTKVERMKNWLRLSKHQETQPATQLQISEGSPN